MAKFTGTIGNPSVDASGNKIVKPIGEPIDIVFYAKGKAPIIRKTDADGKYDFTLVNGSYQVSMYLSALPEEFRIRADLRDGEFFVVATNSPVGAFQEWIDAVVDANKPEDNPIIKHIQGQLDAMQLILDQFRDETQQDGTGKFVMQSSTKSNSLKDSGAYNITSNPLKPFSAGDHGLTSIQQLNILYPNFKVSEYFVGESHVHYYVQQNFSTTKLVVFFNGYLGGGWAIATQGRNDVWIFEGYKNNLNTTIGNHGQLHNGAGLPTDLLAVGDAGLGDRITTLYGTGKQLGELTSGKSGFYANNAYDSGYEKNYTIYLKHSGAYESALVWNYRGTKLTLEASYDNYKNKIEVLHDGNTVVDSNGNYKPASPVVQLHHDRVEYNEDFDKDNPPKFEHLETGVYRITNVREICKDGWTFNKPIDGKGQHYFMIKWEQVDETTLIVRVFERIWNDDLKDWDFGEPKNIGENERWIDFHFEVDHERIAREEAQMQKEQEEFEEQERLRKEAEELAEKEANARYEAEMARQEAEMLAEMEAEHKEE